jgi:hypothetical protein
MSPQIGTSCLGRCWSPVVALLVLLAGCAGEGSHRGGPRTPPPPPLAGEESFFNGQITAELKVGARVGFDGKDGEKGPGNGGGGHHNGPGGGRFHMGMGGGGMGGGHMGGRPEGGPFDSDRAPAMRGGMGMAAGAGGPPMMIHLRFINHGTEAAELLVMDFLSPLGNFVVQPEKVSLAPGEAVEVEPMTSRLAGEVSDTGVTLALHLHGKTEKKTIVLRVAHAAPPGAPPH